jgi:hypothetical protein
MEAATSPALHASLAFSEAATLSMPHAAVAATAEPPDGPPDDPSPLVVRETCMSLRCHRGVIEELHSSFLRSKLVQQIQQSSFSDRAPRCYNLQIDPKKQLEKSYSPRFSEPNSGCCRRHIFRNTSPHRTDPRRSVDRRFYEARCHRCLRETLFL